MPLSERTNNKNKVLFLVALLILATMFLFTLSGCGEIQDGFQSIFIKGNMDSYLKDKYNQNFYATGEWDHMWTSVIDGQGKWIFGRRYKYKDTNDVEFSVNVNYEHGISDNYESTMLNKKFEELVKENDKNVKSVEVTESKASSDKINSLYELYSKSRYRSGLRINYELHNSSNADKENLINALTKIYSRLPDNSYEWIMADNNPWSCFSFENNTLKFKAWTQENINAYNKTNNFLKKKYNEDFTLENYQVFYDWNDAAKKVFHYVSNDVKFTAEYNNGTISDNYLSRYFEKTNSDTKELEAQVIEGLKKVDAALEIYDIDAQQKDKNIDSLTYVGDKDSYILNNPTKFEYFVYITTEYGMDPTNKENRINLIKEVFKNASINVPCVIRVVFSDEALLLDYKSHSANTNLYFLKGSEISL